MTIPPHHKDLARYLNRVFGEPMNVAIYKDNSGKRPIAIGAYGVSKKCFYSTIGLCDQTLNIPAGRFELAAMGAQEWLPNALASSFYWLRDRSVLSWPLVCEDTVRHNAKSRFRHMVFVPSTHAYALALGEPVRWLLGFPIKDSEIGIDFDTAQKRACEIHPTWMEGIMPNQSPKPTAPSGRGSP